ncbi:MAG: T9SS type A sorting domain-containing protein [Crocinitomicaceae bacterium]|nr:T9SS type A sorting domain-containing protein [Crocinitomicaceae bacterium]MBK8926667.1 T9SS type A sorting domain-containing protein [Crocinitomicaceae bacterium]
MKQFFAYLTPVIIVLYSANNSFAQKLLQENWESNYTHQDSIFNVSTDLDANGDVFVTGYVVDLTEGRNIITLKYDSDGTLLWSNIYHFGSDDRGFKNLCDGTGNVYTLGRISNGGTSSLIVLKYDSAGNQVWAFSHTIGVTNEPSDMLINSDGNIVILGDALVGGQHDVILAEINPFGSLVANYQYDSGANDYPVNLDGTTGKIALGLTIDDGLTISSRLIQFNNSLTVDWYKDLTYGGLYEVRAIKYDQNNDLISLINNNDSLNEAVLFKYSSIGDSLWTKNLDAGNTYEPGKSLFIDGFNNAIATYVHNGQSEVSVNLVNENGELEWNKYYYSGGLDFKNFSVISDNTRIIVAGTESNLVTSNMVMFSLNYDAVLRWQYHENGNGGNRNQLTDFDFNTNNHILMTGQIKYGTLYQIAVFDLVEEDAFNAPDVSNAPTGTLAYFPYFNQTKDINGNTIEGLCFYGNLNSNGNFLFNKSLIHTEILNDGDTTTIDSVIRWDFTFMGDFRPQVPTGINPSGYYVNYYYADVQREKIDAFKKVIYSNAYEKIDMEIGANYFGNTIFFIVKPGADYHEISWNINGASVSVNSDGSLSCTSNGHIQTYQKPIVYQLDSFGNPVQIGYSTPTYGYALDVSQTVAFHFPTGFYDTSKPLIIELTQTGTSQNKSSEDNFKWCSYIRLPNETAFGEAKINKIDTDDNNNSYYVGQLESSGLSAFPTTPGILVDVPQGYVDMTVMKLNNEIEIEWATYYGGTGGEAGLSIAVGLSSTSPKVFITGTSNSSDFPLVGLVGSYLQNSTGESCIVQLDHDGTADWSTRFEAKLNDCEIVENKIFVVGTFGIQTPPLLDDGVNYYSENGKGYIANFKPGGFFSHGTYFGTTAADPDGYCEITAIDWNGLQNYALTGITTSPSFNHVNAPGINFTTYGGIHTDAFIASVHTLGNIDFAYYIYSPPYSEGPSIPIGYDLYYYPEGDRGNDIKFSPDGQSIYLVGEIFSDNLFTYPPPSGDSYFQGTRFWAKSVFDLSLRPAGFIFKTDLSGTIQWSTYYSYWEYQDEEFPMRLQEISFAPNGNFFISGQQTRHYLSDTPQMSEYNIPLPLAQPVGFYYFDSPTYTPYKGGTYQESFIIGFNQTDELLWATYLGGWQTDQVKSISVSNNDRLYFSGAAYTINSVDALDPDFIGASATEEEIYSLEDWEYNTAAGSNDWFNGDGAGDQCEFAGFFEVSGLDNSTLSESEVNQSGEMTVYPNPNSTSVLFISIGSDIVQSVKIYSITGELIYCYNQIGIKYVNIEVLARGTYLIECQGSEGIYKSMFVVS